MQVFRMSINIFLTDGDCKIGEALTKGRILFVVIRYKHLTRNILKNQTSY